MEFDESFFKKRNGKSSLIKKRGNLKISSFSLPPELLRIG